MPSSADKFADISILPRSLGLTDESEELRERRDLIVARVGARLVGIYADEAAGVTEWRAPVPLPRAPQGVWGVVSLRGRMVLVLDPLAVLGEPDKNQARSFLIALHGDEQLALAVDAMERIIVVFLDEIEPVQHGASVVSGIIQRDGEIIAVLKTEELFAAAMLGEERRRQRT